MTVAILGFLTFVVLTVGLMLHGIYLESKIDLPCRAGNKRHNPERQNASR